MLDLYHAEHEYLDDAFPEFPLRPVNKVREILRTFGG